MPLRSCLYVLSNTYAKFESQFIKRLSSTEAELKKDVAYENVTNYSYIVASSNTCIVTHRKGKALKCNIAYANVRSATCPCCYRAHWCIV